MKKKFLLSLNKYTIILLFSFFSLYILINHIYKNKLFKINILSKKSIKVYKTKPSVFKREGNDIQLNIL